MNLLEFFLNVFISVNYQSLQLATNGLKNK